MTARALPFPYAALVATASLGLLAGCMTGPVGVGAPVVTRPAATSLKVAVLLPLTGSNAALGHDLQQAVQLALGPDGPQPDFRDTASTPTGATAATQAAVLAGDVMIVGPLTQGETAAAAAVANGTPILAFTSDRQQARPGVWPLGITPQQQVARLVSALSTAGKTNIAAVLPSNSFGDALAAALTRSTASVGTQPPIILRYPNANSTALESALRGVTGRTTAPTPAPDATDPPPPPAPLPFNALLLAEAGPTLRTVAAHLHNDGVTMPDVQVVGPATWARDAANLGGLVGAWYAAPDPAARAAFVQAYTARFNAPPPGFADIAYDAAQLARVAAGNPGLLTRPSGFGGVDGPLALRPDGGVVRGLAVFAVGPTGAQIVEPAPASVAPGS